MKVRKHKGKMPLADERPAKVSIWRLGGLHWKDLVRKVWSELYAGTMLTHAAALGFYFLFALFPLLIVMVTIIGFMAERGTALRLRLFGYMSRVVPPSAYALISKTLDELNRAASGWRLWVGLLTALWFASAGVAAMSGALNAMYGVRESRPWWRVRLLAIGLTLALVVLIISALLLLVYSGEMGEAAANYFDQGERFAFIWATAQLPLAVWFVLVAFAMIYYFAPDLYDQKWYWITPGSATGVALWLIVSGLLRVYLEYAGSYSLTYGSLGAVIVLMLWFYVTGIAILMGGKINAEIENAAARAGVPEAKLHGERASDEAIRKIEPGESGA